MRPAFYSRMQKEKHMSNLKDQLTEFLTTLIKETKPDQTVQSINTYPEETLTGDVAFPFVDTDGNTQALLIHGASFEGIFAQILSDKPISTYEVSLRTDDDPQLEQWK